MENWKAGARLWVSVSFVVLIGSGASAQELTFGQLSGSVSSNDEDALYVLGGSAEFRSINLSYGLDLDFFGSDGDDELLIGLGHIAYGSDNGYIGYGALRYFGFGDGFDATIGILGGEYAFGDTTAGANYQFSDDTGDVAQIYAAYTFGSNSHAYGAASFDAEDSDDGVLYQLGVEYQGAAIEIDGLALIQPEQDYTAIVVDGFYYFDGGISSSRPRTRLGGVLGVVDDGGFGTDTVFGVKGGVQLGNQAWMDAGVGFVDADNDNTTVYSLGIEWTLGKRRVSGIEILDDRFDIDEFAF